MPTETNLQTTASLSLDVPAAYLKREMLKRATKDTVFWGLAEKSSQPQGEGKVCQFVRYERLALPEAPAEEGVTPIATAPTLSTVTAVLDQWVQYVSMSDVSVLTVNHPIFQQFRELLTTAHNELVDRECQVVLMGTSSVYYANNVSARSSLTAADVLTSDDVRRVVLKLRGLGAPTWSGGLYKGVMNFVEGDISKDATFQNAASYSAIQTLRDFDIGRWQGVQWMRSNLIPVLAAMAAGDVVETDLTGGDIPAGTTGFDAGSTVRSKVTRLNATTGFEETIDAEVANTNVAAFASKIEIQSSAATGTYKVYSSLQGGAAGTPTLQCRIRHTTGTATAIILVKSGTPAASNVFVVTPTGPVAPPDCPSGVNVHISYIMGKGFFGATTLGGLQTFVTPATASDSDPAAQRRKMSYKQMFKALILNNDFGYRVESASAFQPA
jgi:N4-gp56 family major capsid protein